MTASQQQIELHDPEQGTSPALEQQQAVISSNGQAAGAATAGNSSSAVVVRDAKQRVWTARSIAHKVYLFALDQWFIIGLGIAIGFAAAVPKLGATGGYIQAQYSIKLPAIIIIFIISGLGLKTKALLTAAGDLRIHFLVQGLSLAAVPALGYAIALGLRRSNFDPHLADGVVIMACMPTTVSTNVVYTQRAAGNEPAALVNAVLGNIIGIFITPLWLSHFLDVQGAAPYADVLIELTYTIIGPLIVGQLMQFFTPKAVAWIKAHINTANVSSFCILLLVWLTFCNTFGNSTVRTVPGRDVAATVFLDVALFILFVVVCFVVAWPPPPLQALRRVLRLRRPDAVAVVICGSTKTVAMGVPLISVMYKQVPHAGLLALPLIVYHALQVLLGGLMLEPLKNWCLAGNDTDGGEAAAGAGGKATAGGHQPGAVAGGGPQQGSSGAPSEVDADGDSSRRSGSSRWSLLPHRLRRGGGGDEAVVPSSSSVGGAAV